MSNRSQPVRITIILLPEEHRPFASATRRLRRIMGSDAPSVEILIHANLRGRDARGLADDYLDSVDWPMAERRPNVRMASHSTARPVTLPRSRRTEARLRPPQDPSRN